MDDKNRVPCTRPWTDDELRGIKQKADFEGDEEKADLACSLLAVKEFVDKAQDGIEALAKEVRRVFGGTEDATFDVQRREHDEGAWVRFRDAARRRGRAVVTDEEQDMEPNIRESWHRLSPSKWKRVRKAYENAPGGKVLVRTEECVFPWDELPPNVLGHAFRTGKAMIEKGKDIP